MTDQEIRKPIKGFEGLYEISNTGNIYSLHRIVRSGNHNFTVQPRKLKKSVICGYFIINLRKNGKAYPFKVHRLLASTFIGEIPKGWVINHLDCNRQNNSLENLEITTIKGNNDHAIKMGRNYKSVGENRFNSKLTNAQVLEIRRRYKNGESNKKLSDEFGTVASNITDIVKRLAWKHI